MQLCKWKLISFFFLFLMQYLLSSSVDKTVCLWRVGYDHCLKVFLHNNYVTCIQFNPVDDDHFISGSIDGKVCIWAIPDCYVVDWTDVREIVIAMCYRPDGQGGIIGCMTGNCRFYNASEVFSFDKSIPDGNDLGGLCKDDCGFFCFANHLLGVDSSGGEDIDKLAVNEIFEVASNQSKIGAVKCCCNWLTYPAGQSQGEDTAWWPSVYKVWE